MRKILFLLFSIVTFYLAGSYQLSALMQLFFVELFFFIAMFLLSRYLKQKLDVHIDVNASEILKGENVKGRLIIENRGKLPVNLFKLRLKYFQNGLSGAGSKEIKGSLPRKSQLAIEFQVSSPYCGVLCFQTEWIKAYDYLKLFHGKKKKRLGSVSKILILPSGVSMYIEAESTGWPVPEDQSVLRPGEQPPEIYQIQPYQPGDSIRNIHWKLSAKQDEILTKRYTADEKSVVGVFLDPGKDRNVDIKRLDAFREVTSALSLGLLKAGQPHRIWWHDKAMNQYTSWKVASTDDYRSMMEQFLTADIDSPSANNDTDPFPGVDSYQITGQTFLRLNLNLELYLNREPLIKFSSENYLEEIERRCLIV